MVERSQPLNQHSVPRVEFEATVRDALEVELRALHRSPLAKRWHRRDAIVTSVLSGLGIFIFLGLTRPPAPMDFRIVFLAAWMVGIPLALMRVYRSEGKVRMERYLREQLGDGPIPVAIELRPQGLWIRQANMEVLLDWKEATAVEDTSAGVEIVFRVGPVVALERAFTSADQRAAFAARARALMKGQQYIPDDLDRRKRPPR